jgi:ammonia channel protein AmtB
MIMFLSIKHTIGMRVEEEELGLDISEHGVSGYELITSTILDHV